MMNTTFVAFRNIVAKKFVESYDVEFQDDPSVLKGQRKLARAETIRQIRTILQEEAWDRASALEFAKHLPVSSWRNALVSDIAGTDRNHWDT